MDKRWYPAAFSAVLAGCGGSAADAGTGGTTGRQGNPTGGVDAGMPLATGGAVQYFYGVFNGTGATIGQGGATAQTGGQPGGGSANGGKSSIDGGTPSVAGRTSTGGAQFKTAYGVVSTVIAVTPAGGGGSGGAVTTGGIDTGMPTGGVHIPVSIVAIYGAIFPSRF